MLDFDFNTNSWEADYISEEEMDDICRKYITRQDIEWDHLIIFKSKPYIDTLYVTCECRNDEIIFNKKRFTFHEGYRWSFRDEKIFMEKCLKNKLLQIKPFLMDELFEYYSTNNPDWKLKRYFIDNIKLLDQIYHCMRRGSVKEILYKAGLDELAFNFDYMDEYDLLSKKPTEIYGGVSMRVLRALNSKDGAILLSKASSRKFVKELQAKFPDIFKEKLNNAQCRYLNFLIEGDLTVGEAGRLFGARRLDLLMMWAPSQIDMYIWRERMNSQVIEVASEIAKIDKIYEDYIRKTEINNLMDVDKKINMLRFYLLNQRDEYNALFRRSNRKRDQELQERKHGYVVRFPQTINDFLRESVYMCNCLMTYVDAYINNDTTILFMRKTDDYNSPFITIEIFGNELMQAYHRFNRDCTKEEAEWICDYCERHGIGHSKFNFNSAIDELF